MLNKEVLLLICLLSTLSGVTLLYSDWVNTLTVIHMKMAAVIQDA